MVSKTHPWIRWATGLLLIVAVAIEIVHHRSQLQETRSRRDYVTTPDIILAKLERFAALGEAGTVPLDINVAPDTSGLIVSEAGVVYNVTALDPSGTGQSNSNKFITIPLLAFAFSKEKRVEWEDLAVEIQGAKKTIDPELYSHFQEVVELHQQHPWPNVNEKEKIVASDWDSKDLSRTWIDKNRRLQLLVQKRIALRNLPQS